MDGFLRYLKTMSVELKNNKTLKSRYDDNRDVVKKEPYGIVTPVQLSQESLMFLLVQIYHEP